MTVSDAARRTAALFALAGREVLEVRGGDRARWLDGQITQALPEADGAGGCYAFVLTPAGRIVADVHVLVHSDRIWLDTDRAALAPLRARLEKLVIADDVELADAGGGIAHLALEGPRAAEVLREATGAPLALARDAAGRVSLGGAEIPVAAYGWSGEEAFQLFVPRSAREAVEAALLRTGRPLGLVVGEEATLWDELRVEAGIPRYGAELGEDVLPAETGWLDRAVSFAKGCYVGQEVVARMASRGRVAHHLVGIVWPGEAPPAPGARLEAKGRQIGEVTSSARSPRAGAISLAYVAHGSHEAGTPVHAGDLAGEVHALPFVPPARPGDLATASP